MVIWIGYTTTYREGGAKFTRAAQTLASEKRAEFPGCEVRCEVVDTKRAFVEAMASIDSAGKQIKELHFIGHSGMYGIMFRSTAMPEQFSPHEWRQLRIPFSESASAYFHACRTARWFAPFFARTFNVTAYGYHWYTTLSTSKERFSWDLWPRSEERPLYIIACPGKKSHGMGASLLKHTGITRSEVMKRFTPSPLNGDATYDSIARLYDQAFEDLSVRQDECNWITKHLPDGMPRVLDVGCGNGALLRKFAGRISLGVGVDLSAQLLTRARARSSQHLHLSYKQVTSPTLPFADGSFDVVTSMLSFRYLDWDPILNELRRVLAPGGRLLIVDMVTVPARFTELPRVIIGKLRQIRQTRRHPRFRFALRELVKHPEWQTMLRYNPIRSEHEFRWYLESRFQGRRVEPIHLAYSTRVLGFDSGPLQPGWVPPQSYP